MAITHVLSDADSIHGLAARYNVTWQEIVEFNDLEYPYTLTSFDAYQELYGSGYLTVTRGLFSSALTFYAGSTFQTDIDAQGIQKVYELVEDTTLPAGVATGYLFVRCTVFGSFGNSIAGAINQPGKLSTSLGEFVSALTVSNDTAFTNGVDVRVRITGQTVVIPTSTEDVPVTTADASMLALGGEDLLIGPDGDLTDDGFGDLATASGIDNIKQAINHRLITRRGSITQHPNYGSRLHELLGKAQTEYVYKLMELDVQETLLMDDRVTDVLVRGVLIQGSSVYVDVEVQVNQSTIRTSATVGTTQEEG